MKKDNAVFLNHIYQAILKIELFVKGVDEEKFLNSEIIQSAVIRELEVIGEATKNISRQFKERYKHIHWKNMSGMRDVLIHAYFDVDLKTVWKTIENRVPELKRNIKTILENE